MRFKSYNDYNPTACLAGFIFPLYGKNSELYKRGCRIAKEAVDQLLIAERENGMHTITCYLRLMQYFEKARVTDIWASSSTNGWDLMESKGATYGIVG